MIKATETERDAMASAKASTHTNATKIQKWSNLRVLALSLPPYWLARSSSGHFATHGHGDHWFTAGVLAERLGAQVVASAGTIK
jgi:phosphoribosyl 1,2-cyclic phosphodiesterase